MKKFKITMIVMAAIGLAALLLSLLINWVTREEILPRDNDLCTTEERVFDFADKLTDREEEKLRDLIDETEPKIGCDIVLMTIEESSLTSDYAMMNFADDFYDENYFGWEEPEGYSDGGDGAIFVANWARDEYGDSYAWFSTGGKVEEKYSNEMIDALINKVCSKLRNSPYNAFVTYIETLEKDMTSKENGVSVPWLFYPVLGIIAAVAFILANFPKKAGENTTGKQTYVKQEDVNMLRKEDTFLNKSVTHVKIQSSSGGSGGGGGGGGHHTSSGGRSHGGGGGRF